jgi:hypothetical protein
MTKNSFSTRGLADPITPTLPISSTRIRCFFAKKFGTPHPPYPVEPVFDPEISCNKPTINSLPFSHVN